MIQFITSGDDLAEALDTDMIVYSGLLQGNVHVLRRFRNMDGFIKQLPLPSPVLPFPLTLHYDVLLLCIPYWQLFGVSLHQKLIYPVPGLPNEIHIL